MSKPYRLTIRLSREASKENEIIHYLETLSGTSKNAFVIDALEHYISYLSGGDNKLLSDIRQIFREEVHTLPTQPIDSSEKWSPVLSEADSKENEQNVLDDLEMFG